MAPVIEEMMDTGLIAVSNIQIQRVRKQRETVHV
jgi:hypothetical protein